MGDTGAEMRRRAVTLMVLHADSSRLCEVLTVARNHPSLTTDDIVDAALRGVRGSISSGLTNLLVSHGRLDSTQSVSMDALYSTALGSDVRPALLPANVECAVKLLTKLPARVTRADLQELPYGLVARFIGAESQDRAEFMRTLADRLEHMAVEVAADSVERLRSMATAFEPLSRRSGPII